MGSKMSTSLEAKASHVQKGWDNHFVTENVAAGAPPLLNSNSLIFIFSTMLLMICNIVSLFSCK